MNIHVIQSLNLQTSSVFHKLDIIHHDINKQLCVNFYIYYFVVVTSVARDNNGQDVNIS